jgi:serine O-acetyltransferase
MVVIGEKPSGMDLQHGDLPDPVAKVVSCMMDQIHHLEAKVADLTKEQKRLQTELEQGSRVEVVEE